MQYAGLAEEDVLGDAPVDAHPAAQAVITAKTNVAMLLAGLIILHPVRLRGLRDWLP
jgi:hypothetical protein